MHIKEFATGRTDLPLGKLKKAINRCLFLYWGLVLTCNNCRVLCENGFENFGCILDLSFLLLCCAAVCVTKAVKIRMKFMNKPHNFAVRNIFLPN